MDKVTKDAVYSMGSETKHRPTWAEINLDNLAFNFHSVKDFVGENIKYMAIVKV